jgi:hypothetical protein
MQYERLRPVLRSAVATLGLCLIAGFLFVAKSSPGRAQEHAVADLPADVGAFISRRVGCNELNARKRANAERAADLQTRLYLKCESIALDEEALRQKYHTDPDALVALDGTWIKIIRRVPVKAAPGNQSDLDQ